MPGTGGCRFTGGAFTGGYPVAGIGGICIASATIIGYIRITDKVITGRQPRRGEVTVVLDAAVEQRDYYVGRTAFLIPCIRQTNPPASSNKFHC